MEDDGSGTGIGGEGMEGTVPADPAQGTRTGPGWELSCTLRVARREMVRTLLSIRSAVLLVLMLLLVVGGAYGISQIYLADDLATISAIIYRTPDSVLYLVSSFTALIVPVASVVLSFDSIQRERELGTMDLLLVKPMARESLALGKFLGTLGTLSVLLMVVSILAIGMIGAVTGRLPTARICLTFILSTILLAGIYTGITQAASLYARSHGSAVMMGVFVWMFFTTFWVLVPLSYAFTMGIPYDVNDPEFLRISNMMDVFNPNGAYNLFLAYESGNGALIEGVSPVDIILSIMIWFFLPMIILVTAFPRTEK